MVDGDAKEVICFGTNVLRKYMVYLKFVKKNLHFLTSSMQRKHNIFDKERFTMSKVHFSKL